MSSPPKHLPTGSSATVETQRIMTLGMIANTVDCFSGRERVREYFDKIELRARLDNWDEKTTLNIIKYRLTGNAYQFYKSDSTLDSELVGYATFKERLIKKFSPVTLPGEALLNLTKCYQRHEESVAHFVIRLKTFGADILKEDLLAAKPNEKAGLEKKCNELVLNQFRIGLKRELLRQLGPVLMRTEHLTIEKAEEYARQEELNDLMLRNRQPTVPVMAVNSITCYQCGKTGHVARNCRPQNLQRAQPENFRERNFGQPSRQPREFHNWNQNYRTGYSHKPNYNQRPNFHNNAPVNSRYETSRFGNDQRIPPEHHFTNRPPHQNPAETRHPSQDRSQTLNLNPPPFVPRNGGQ